MDKRFEFTREALYQMVWRRPVSVIAKEIGVSDVAVAKACRKAGIPLPSRGYWAMIKAGRTVRTPALSGLKPGQSATVSFFTREDPPPKVPKPDLPVGPPMAVPCRLTKPHPLVAQLKAAAHGAREEGGVLVLNYTRVLRVRTSARQLRRGLILLDTLIKQFEKRGYNVRISQKSAETELVLNEGVVTFRLDERTKKTVPPSPPPMLQGRRGEHYPDLWRPAQVLAGTGEFKLEFGKYALRGCRITWKDGVRRTLEAQLSEVIATIPSWEAALHASRLEREDREVRACEAEKRRVATARAQEVLKLQRGKLVGNLRAWERAERLRRFIAAFEQIGASTPEAQAWLEWAHAQAQALDPLVEPEFVADLSVELSDYFTGRSAWEKPVIDWWTTL